MRRDDLVCANCSGRVSEGRCAVCRAARDQYRNRGPRFYAPLWAVLAVLGALVCALALQSRYA
jgi:hypothetical protein